MKYLKLSIVVVFFINVLFANQNYQNKNGVEKILFCLYKELKHPVEILNEEDLMKKEHIENLLYSKIHDKEYFLKALVLDYLYNGKNIEDFYKNAYLNADTKDKAEIGIYYSIYLQKNGNYKEAISLLRGIYIFASKSFDIPTKVAYAYSLSSQKGDIETESFLKRKKIDMNKIKEDINDCSN